MLHPKGQAPILQHSNTADFFFSHSSPFHSINIHNILCDRQQQQNWLGERKKKWETGWKSWTKWIKIWMQEAPCREGNFDPDYVTYLEDDDHWNIKIIIRIIFLAPWIHHKNRSWMKCAPEQKQTKFSSNTIQWLCQHHFCVTSVENNACSLFIMFTDTL